MNPTNALSDVRLADEVARVHQLPAEHLAEHFQDHIGIGTFGKSGDMDILFVCTIYHVGGRQWGIKDGAVMQTNLVVTTSPRAGPEPRRDDGVAKRGHDSRENRLSCNHPVNSPMARCRHRHADSRR
jgi:hypothetical protein